MILISHNLHDVFEVADTITVLRLGQNVAEFKRTRDATSRRSSRRSPPASCRRCPASRGGRRHERHRPADATAAARRRRRGQRDRRRLRPRAGGPDVRGGELGSLPIVVGLIIIAIVFQTQNSNFLTAGNFVNLIVQAAAYAMIAMGIVFVLLLGEIDLSVGFVCGVGRRASTALLLHAGRQRDRPTFLGDRHRARAPGAAIGTLHGLLITKIGIPSFVVTLAGLLAWNGVVLLLIGDRGTVILAERLRRSASRTTSCRRRTAWIVLSACVAHLRGDAADRGRMSRAKARAADRADRARRPARRRAARWSARSSSPSPTRTAASRTSFLVLGGAVPVLDVRAQPHEASGATSTRSAATPRRRGARASTSTASRSRASRSAR